MPDRYCDAEDQPGNACWPRQSLSAAAAGACCAHLETQGTGALEPAHGPPFRRSARPTPTPTPKPGRRAKAFWRWALRKASPFRRHRLGRRSFARGMRLSRRGQCTRCPASGRFLPQSTEAGTPRIRTARRLPALNSRTIVRRPDNSFAITVASRAAPGNWIEVAGTGPMSLVLTVYDSNIAAGTELSEASMPQHCFVGLRCVAFLCRHCHRRARRRHRAHRDAFDAARNGAHATPGPDLQ